MNTNLTLSIALICFALAAGCSPSGPQNETPPSGKIIVRGSNTVGEELAPRLIAAYKKEHPAAAFDLETKGTSYGLGALMGGFCDIAGASREPNKNEQEVAKFRNVELNDYVIGHYSVAVVVNAANPIASLTKEQVRDLFTGVITNWSAVGGADLPVHLLARDPSSGTYLGFKELAMDNNPYGLEENLFTNYSGLVEAVSRDVASVGYSSLDLTSQPGVKAVAIGGIKADAASVNSGIYPYARKLHLFTAKGRETPGATDFIRFVLSPAGQKTLAQAGDTPLP
jgi:phosphate transport system substrate-binding protein